MAADRHRRGLRGMAPALVLGLALSGGAWAQSGGEGVRFNPENPVTPAFREAIEADDAARRRRAEQEGESFSPTFDRPAVRTGPPAATLPAATLPTAPAAAAAVPPDIAEPPAEAGAAPDEAPDPGRAAPPAAQYRERLPERGGQRGQDREASSPFDALLDLLNEPPAKAAWLEYAHEAGEGKEDRAGPARGAAAPVLPAALAELRVGRGLYSRMLYEANSDWPGPVVLEVLEPPLAGAVATGAFQEQGERLVIRIDRLSLGPRSWAIEGWAVDPGCACYGVRGIVDRHWFQRVLLPSALAFAEGFLDAAARTAQVVARDASGASITIESAAPTHRQQVYAGTAAAARRVGSVLLESAPDGPTVRVPADTELVLVVTALPESESPAGRAGPAPGAASPERRPPVAVIDGGAGTVGARGAGSGRLPNGGAQ